ncbi:class II aldolase/adducin family protein [Ramlibacter sp.]|uniref:class II aldolase/adducin family protein n=1 Tax=Ramlibacter sp. TaxID=1917967 RepID=UPI003D119B51
MRPAPSLDDLQRQVRIAARALARTGLVTAFGHCSVRLSAKEFLVCAARPMASIGVGEAGTRAPVEGELPQGVLGEVRMHQQIYRRRADVHAICRFISPQVTALAAMGCSPSARHGFSSYFYPRVPMWNDPALVRNDAAAAGVAETLGDAPAVVVAVNGAVTVGADMPRALSLAWFLEDAARVELAVRAAGGADHRTFANAQAAAQRATWDGRIAERMWEFMTATDPELPRSPNPSIH